MFWRTAFQPGGNMRIDTIPATQLSREHIAAWRTLQQADPALDSPLFQPEFTQAVAAVRDDVEVAVLEEAGEFVGFFPFERSQGNVGRPVAGSLADMQGIILRSNIELDAAQLIRACGLTTWQFDHLIASQRLFQPYHAFIDDSPYINLSAGYDAYKTERRASGSSLITQAERKGRKLAREVGPLRLEWNTDYPNTLSQLVAWKREQLQRRSFVDPYGADWVNGLLERICETQTDRFAGVLTALFAGEQMIAAHLGMRGDAVLSSWIPAYDHQLARYSPGLVLHVEMAKHAATIGIERIDLGRGYNDMKSGLASAAIPVAVGCIECRPLRRALSAGWFCARNLVHATPLRGAPLRFYRRLRNRFVKA